MNKRTKTRAAKKRHATRSWFAIALTMFAALIWAKLRLVGGVPRVVYAEPDASENKAKAQPSPESSDRAPATPRD